jgi:hypothetical protein
MCVTTNIWQTFLIQHQVYKLWNLGASQKMPRRNWQNVPLPFSGYGYKDEVKAKIWQTILCVSQLIYDKPFWYNTKFLNCGTLCVDLMIQTKYLEMRDWHAWLVQHKKMPCCNWQNELFPMGWRPLSFFSHTIREWVSDVLGLMILLICYSRSANFPGMDIRLSQNQNMTNDFYVRHNQIMTNLFDTTPSL